MGSGRPEEAEAVIIGAPFDSTTSFRPGARFAPQLIRQVSYVLEEYSPELDGSLEEVRFFDAGNLDMPAGAPGPALSLLREAVAELAFKPGLRLFLLGGEHLVTLPAVEAALAFYPDLCVLQFDAHADLRHTYGGEKFSHATVMRRIAEIVGPRRVYQFGIRSGSREEFRFGQENTSFFPYEITGPLETVLPELTGRPLYVTIDIDVVDPGYAPGTGTPEPGGVSAAEMIAVVRRLSALTIIGFDVVEVCPPADHSWTTAVLAAKIVREALIGLGSR